VLCGAALGVTGYLAVTALRTEDVAGCGGGALWDCGYALHSRWSKIFGLPVSVPAFALYAVVFTSLFVCQSAAPRSGFRLAWGTVTIGTMLAGLAAVWFISLLVFAVGHICAYCLAAHACGLALCLAILWKRPMGARTTTRLSGVSAFGVSALIVGQAFSTPPATFKIEVHPIGVVTSNSSATAAPDVHSKRQDTSRTPVVFEPPTTIPTDSGEEQ